MNISEIVKNTIAELDELKTTLQDKKTNNTISEDDIRFIKDIKKKIDILFLGLQSESIRNIEDKVEITLEYLKFLSETIDKKINGASK